MPFSCSKCDKKFSEETLLQSHEELHSEKPPNCDKCGKKSLGVSEQNKITISSEEDLAETFNHYFPSKVANIEKEIPIYNINPASKLKESLKDRNLKFGLGQVTKTQVKKAIKGVRSKTSSGVDFINTKILKMSSEVIAAPLTRIINKSVESGVFPNSWKISKCIPLFKNKGKRTDKSKYRPVSLLKATSKVIESTKL